MCYTVCIEKNLIHKYIEFIYIDIQVFNQTDYSVNVKTSNTLQLLNLLKTSYQFVKYKSVTQGLNLEPPLFFIFVDMT